MSYNLVDPTTGDLTRVAGNSNIVDSAIGINSTWSSKKISTDLDNKINKTDITATIDSTSTDTQIPSAKSVYDTTSKFLRTYTSITELGLTVGSETIEDIANSMGDKTRLITLIFEADNNMSIYPYKNGTLIVEKINIYRVNLKFCEDISSNVYVGSYHGEKGFTGWQELATTDSTLKTIQLSGSVDCNTLTETGLYTASAVSSLINAPVNNQVQLDGGFSILVTKTNVDGVYYGMQMFIPYGSDAPFIRKAYYFNNGQYWTSWEQLATMDNVNQCVENKRPNAKTVSFELNSASWNCGTIYGNTNNGGNFKYDYYVTRNNTVELVKQDGYGQQGSITASINGTTLTLTADGIATIKTVTIIKC